MSLNAAIMKHPVHVAYLSPTSHLYGSERSLLEVLRAIDRERFVPYLITVAGGPLEGAARTEGVVAVRFPWLSGVSYRHPVRWLASLVRLVRCFRAHRIAIVELNLVFAVDVGLLLMAARLAGAKFVVRNRVMSPLSRYQRFWLSQADSILAVSERAATRWCEQRRSGCGVRIQPDRVTVMPSGRNIRQLGMVATHAPLVRSLGIPENVRIIGMVAAIEPRKRQDLFLKAAALIHARRQDVWFILVGGTYGSEKGRRYEQQLRQQVAEGGLADRVVFTGYRDDAMSITKQFDVLVMPSSEEAGAGVLIEAMGLGIPIVASHADGTPEIVVDGVTGLLVREADPEAYANAILRLLEDPSYAARLVESAKARAQQFDSGHVTRLVERCYEAVLRRQGDRGTSRGLQAVPERNRRG